MVTIELVPENYVGEYPSVIMKIKKSQVGQEQKLISDLNLVLSGHRRRATKTKREEV